MVEDSWKEGDDGVMRPKAVASAALRSAAHTINPGWTAADCIAHLILLATEIEGTR
jgi:hypothetical protein